MFMCVRVWFTGPTSLHSENGLVACFDILCVGSFVDVRPGKSVITPASFLHIFHRTPYTAMDLSSVIRRGHPAAFSLLIIWALIVGIISSAVVADFNKEGHQPRDLVRDSTRFMVFTGWWTFLLSIIYVRILWALASARCQCVWSRILTFPAGSLYYWYWRFPLVDC